MSEDLIEQIVGWVESSQANAQSRFGGFHYGDSFVVRDHVAERRQNKTVEVFRAPYDLCDHDDVMARVRRKHVINDLRGILSHRPEQVLRFVTESSRS